MRRAGLVVLVWLAGCGVRAPAPIDVDGLPRARGPVEARRDLVIRTTADPRDVAGRLGLAALDERIGRPSDAIAELEAVVALGGEVEGYLRASEFSRDRIEDLRTVLKEGDKLQAMIINIDRKNRSINLSVKAKDLSEETDAMKQLRTENAAASAGATNLGALLRAKLDKGGGNPPQ